METVKNIESHQLPRATGQDAMTQQESPFLNPGKATKANTLAIIQLAKDDHTPVYLRDCQGEHDGYKEGHVLNTRFGSFPHSTLIGVPWGSQVRASNVDTGSRGRKKKANQKQLDKETAAPQDASNGINGEVEGASSGSKRKRDANDNGEKRTKRQPDEPATPAETEFDTTAEQARETEDAPVVDANEAREARDPSQKQKKGDTTVATSGFVHILPPTPEIWTSSLPHRTQVVYTPDYSYVLQRIRARPGSRLIEAGSGSGSFTHASARAVYDGHHGSTDGQKPTGKVFSFEFHEQRFDKMRKEIQEHGLSQLVEINHRDVYNEGFLVDGKSPGADAVFLDLPAPWLALPHLSRRQLQTGNLIEGIDGSEDKWISPLNPKKSVYICTFSPCIEQVTRTVSEMRKLGWVEIDMVEISHKRIQVFREKIGLNIVSERGMQQAPKDVEEALARLKEIEVKAAEHNAKMMAQHSKVKDEDDEDVEYDAKSKVNGASDDLKAEVIHEESKDAAAKPFMQGQLVTLPEMELKAHTSYLVFAILPREWTDEDESAAAAKWPIGKEQKVIGTMDRAARKQQKREQMQGGRKKSKKAKEDGKAKAKAKAAVETASETASKDADVTMGEAQAVEPST